MVLYGYILFNQQYYSGQPSNLLIFNFNFNFFNFLTIPIYIFVFIIAMLCIFNLYLMFILAYSIIYTIQLLLFTIPHDLKQLFT